MSDGFDGGESVAAGQVSDARVGGARYFLRSLKVTFTTVLLRTFTKEVTNYE